MFIPVDEILVSHEDTVRHNCRYHLKRFVGQIMYQVYQIEQENHRNNACAHEG